MKKNSNTKRHVRHVYIILHNVFNNNYSDNSITINTWYESLSHFIFNFRKANRRVRTISTNAKMQTISLLNRFV